MQRTNIANLKNRLSSYLRKVRAGETVLVLDRDEPIARIERVSGPAATDERAARLEAQGLIRRPTRPLPLKMLSEPLPRAEQSVLAALLADRAEER
jgi:antitoxin (DNA-binding transcriptional repressor) of toxin-antitoxin stability system